MKHNFKDLLNLTINKNEKEVLEAMIFRALVLRQMHALRESHEKSQLVADEHRTDPCL